MSILRDISIRPLHLRGDEILEKWRQEYSDGTLNLPKGYSGIGVETVCAEKNHTLIGSLTATQSVIIDPFIHDPYASGVDIFSAVYLMDRALCWEAQKGGAVAAYTSVPDKLTHYHDILRKSGYSEVASSCRIFRRPLTPDLT